MRVRITVKNHAPGGTFHVPNPTNPAEFVHCDDEGFADVTKEQFDYLKSKGHLTVQTVKKGKKGAADELDDAGDNAGDDGDGAGTD